MSRPKKKPKPGRSATREVPQAEAARRVDVILRLRLDGGALHDLAAYANDSSKAACEARGGPPWNVSDAELAKLIGRADDLLVARTERRRSRAVAVQLAKRDALYVRAINSGDLGVALSILRDQAQLLSMYPVAAELRNTIKAQAALIADLEAALGPGEEGPRTIEAAPGGDGTESEAVEADGGSAG